jgi:predicted PhzF superfamily epimerase YddE/YHI9
VAGVAPSVEATSPELVERALSALGWAPGELDPSLPPRVAFAGARHLVLAAASRKRLARLDALRELMLEHDLTTLQLVGAKRPPGLPRPRPVPPSVA